MQTVTLESVLDGSYIYGANAGTAVDVEDAAIELADVSMECDDIIANISTFEAANAVTGTVQYEADVKSMKDKLVKNVQKMIDKLVDWFNKIVNKIIKAFDEDAKFFKDNEGDLKGGADLGGKKIEVKFDNIKDSLERLQECQIELMDYVKTDWTRNEEKDFDQMSNALESMKEAYSKDSHEVSAVKCDYNTFKDIFGDQGAGKYVGRAGWRQMNSEIRRSAEVAKRAALKINDDSQGAKAIKKTCSYIQKASSLCYSCYLKLRPDAAKIMHRTVETKKAAGGNASA